MTTKAEAKQGKGGEVLYVRKLNKAGGSRYLSVGKILPPDWEVVKVYVNHSLGGAIVLRLIQIK